VSGKSNPEQRSLPQVRKPYQPPQLARVDLQADEVLATGCKMTTWGIASGSTINCIVRACSAAGS